MDVSHVPITFGAIIDMETIGGLGGSPSRSSVLAVFGSCTGAPFLRTMSGFVIMSEEGTARNPLPRCRFSCVGDSQLQVGFSPRRATDEGYRRRLHAVFKSTDPGVFVGIL